MFLEMFIIFVCLLDSLETKSEVHAKKETDSLRIYPQKKFKKYVGLYKAIKTKEV